MPEVRSEFLDDHQFLKEVHWVCALLEERPEAVLNLTWGFGTDPEYWFANAVGATNVRRFLEDAVVAGIYTWGQADVYIEMPGKEVKITLCHETDLHVESKDEAWIKRSTDRWSKEGIAWWRRETNGGEWIRFPQQ
jgi:hypothetical protein